MAAIALTALPINASKANSQPFSVRQSDGTMLTVVLHGDEDFSWYTTTDGVVIAPIGKHFYIADIDSEGTVLPTKHLAHNLKARGAAELKAISSQRVDNLFSEQATSRRAAMRSSATISTTTPPYFPHTGTPTALAILVNFSDTTFHVTDPVASFEQYLNGDEQKDLGHGEAYNYGSVKKYYSDMSNGIYQPQFKVVGPVTLPKAMSYYGANSGSNRDINSAEFIKAACAEAAKLTDFSDATLDSNGDGIVDLVTIIYAGFGENNGAEESALWAKAISADYGTYNNMKVRRVMMSSELNRNESYLKTNNSQAKGRFSTPQINGIGVFCHEFAHCLGMPDLYPTTTSAQVNNQALEYWSLLDGGEYVYNGCCPTALTAWEREVLGWHTNTTLTSDGEYTIDSRDNNGTTYKMVNPADENDYILFENIQQTGWNKYLYGHGLLAYRVYWPSDKVNHTQRPNNTVGKPQMTIVPADGELISSYKATSGTQYSSSMAGDPFPGTGNVTTLTADQGLVNYKWYTTPSKIVGGLKGICENEDGTVTFTYSADIAAGIDGVKADDKANADRRIFTIDGRYVGKDSSALPQGIYVRGGKKIVVM